MQEKIVLGVLLIMCLSGCATTRKGQDMQVQQLQSRVNSLEAELEKKNQEINNLEDELRKVSVKRLNLEEEIPQTKMSVKQIQIALRDAGFYKGPIDGEIGPQTKEAVKAFQKANGLQADGIVGKKTFLRLRRHLK